jgi:hypothetical protein
MEYNMDKVDEAVLALMYLTRFGDENTLRSWKGYDWDILKRLNEKGFIYNPVGKAKSVAFTYEGAQKSEELFKKLFAAE